MGLEMGLVAWLTHDLYMSIYGLAGWADFEGRKGTEIEISEGGKSPFIPPNYREGQFFLPQNSKTGKSSSLLAQKQSLDLHAWWFFFFLLCLFWLNL